MPCKSKRKTRKRKTRTRTDPNLALLRDSTRALAGVATFGITAVAVSNIAKTIK